jgi:hypothetical protein
LAANRAAMRARLASRSIMLFFAKLTSR